jgi:multidrug efflux system membrane fusion protein
MAPRYVTNVVASLSITFITFAFLATPGCAAHNRAHASSAAGSATTGGGRGDATAVVPVAVATVAQKDVPLDLDAIGNVEAYSTISVKAEVSGELTKVSFQEGDYVKKGDLLFNIDPRSLQAQLGEAQAQLDQAQANVARDRAALDQAEANLARDTANQKYARSEAARYGRLFQQGIVSNDQSDQTRANATASAQTILADQALVESARAQIAASKAAVESARAAVENAAITLGDTTIRSPIDGRTGNLAIKEGSIVTPNTMELVTIDQVHPMYVTFAVPEDKLGSIKKYMAQAKLPVMARSQDNLQNTEAGTLTFIDNGVDPNTGTIKLKGTFANQDNKLWPGEFVRVTLQLTKQPNALVVPGEAVQTGQDGQFVYVVKQDRSVEMRPVVTGAHVDQDLVIESGLALGETIVTEGQLRLAPGVHVRFSGTGIPAGPA